ncbi:hypothetical protein KIW84_044277 [Lathyrus oleraceus]|uniref:Retrovirus-related Pol polyprotein from transposon TNT 1-94-like beta-barrel domain-containing protein n=1 Tax=Pisum sativum TaxID=3888 RepID=A0A9D4XJU9_PEA|nr:hypothetical protein KIW84_044277 [Pisum sativum]
MEVAASVNLTQANSQTDTDVSNAKIIEQGVQGANFSFSPRGGRAGGRSGGRGHGRGSLLVDLTLYRQYLTPGHVLTINLGLLYYPLPTPQQMSAPQAVPNAMLTNTGPAQSNSWFPDSGASFHVTNASQNIQQSTPFEGPDQIFIGNGEGLRIHSSGSSSFLSQFKPSTSLVLHNLLHVPSITKNLTSASSEILLQCRVGKDGLYEFPHLQLIQPPKSSQVSCLALALSIPASSLNSSTGTRFSNSNQNVSESNSCNSHLTWHLRLGHPNPHTMKLVLEQFPPLTEPPVNSSSSTHPIPCQTAAEPISSNSAPSLSSGSASPASVPSMANTQHNSPTSQSSSYVSPPRDPTLQPLPNNSHPMTTRTKSGVPLPCLNPSVFLKVHILTKPLSNSRFLELRSKLNLTASSPPMRLELVREY